MAYLVVALGALMAIAGAYAMYTGSGLIQMEQGWSAFIAGAVLLSGGFVTASVGLLIRALGQWRPKELATAPAGTKRDDAAPLQQDAMQERDHVAVAPVAQPATVVASLPAATLAAAAIDLHEASPTPPTLFAEPAPHAAGHPASADLLHHLDPPFHEEVRSLAPEAHAAPTDRPEHDPQASDPLGSEPWLDALIDEHFGAPAAAPTQPMATYEPAPPTAPPEKEALAAVAAEVEHFEPHDAPESEPVSAHHAPAAHHAEVEEHRAEAPHEPAPAPAEVPADATPAPHADPATPAVIGRYEAEGTSYVMYADGSIEAQSAAGVYRFASMTELKDFIES